MDEDNSLGDCEEPRNRQPLSPKMGGKKIKLNDGTSQESLEDGQEAEEYNETHFWSTPFVGLEEIVTSADDVNLEDVNLDSVNLDSGVSVDLSESTSTTEEIKYDKEAWPKNNIFATLTPIHVVTSESIPGTSKNMNGDGKTADKTESSGASTTAGPSNELVNIAASGSNIRAILVNIQQPPHRNYRKRSRPDNDSDSNPSSRDSDDFSAAEDTTPPRPQEDPDSDAVLQRLLDICSSDNSQTSSSSSSSSPPSSPSINDYESYESDGHVRMHSGDTDTDEDPPWSPFNMIQNEEQPEERKLPEVLQKERPKHNYVILKEIINREMGLTFPYGKTTQEDIMFSKRFYGSLHSVYRLKKLHSLNKHRGCVNSINFHPEGQLLVSGSDDTNIIVWDWAKNISHQTIKTGHKSNVFQSKFLYLNAQSQLNIVTCARDGQVRLIQCPPGGGAGSRRRLLSHTRAAHKLHVTAAEPHSVLSAAEDGLVMHADVRTDHANRLFQVKENAQPIPLYSIHGHPLEPMKLIVAGRDKFVRMYDRRKCTRPQARYSPSFFGKDQPAGKKQQRFAGHHLTSAIYNHDGSEILGSYNDEDIYLFDTEKDVYDVDNTDPAIDGYTKRYSGHRNSATFKGVSFFGPRSQYVVSGSDCSYVYVWDKQREAIVQWMQGDNSGVVNCIETHPKSPVMATSGLDRDVKIWIPRAAADPNYEGMERVVQRNINMKTGIQQIFAPFYVPPRYRNLEQIYHALMHPSSTDQAEDMPGADDRPGEYFAW